MSTSNVREYKRCLGTFSNGADVHFTARFNLRIEEDCSGDFIAGKATNGFLIDHSKHVRHVYKLMLSRRPVVLTCKHFEARISLLSPRRFSPVELLWNNAEPARAAHIIPAAGYTLPAFGVVDSATIKATT